jgi:hypothetical protein
MTEPRPELDPLRELFPLKLGRVQIDLVDADPQIRDMGPDEIWAPIRVITFALDGSIADILEQSLLLAAHPNLLTDADRLRNCIDAHVEVLTLLFARPPARDERADYPSELIHIADLLELRKANSREEFVRALHAGKRLGKRLNPSQSSSS